MANDLTGDYDVVVEFTIPAVNRVLAGMHSGNRLPHSWSLAVDDNPQSSLVARSVVDVSGDAVTDPVLAQAVARAPSSLKGLSARGLPSSSLDPRVVNPGLHRAPALEDRSHLKGVAQLQLAAPTISLPDDSGTLVMLHTPVMARYFPDPSTMSLPEFLHAEIQITFGVDQIARPVATQAGRFIDVNLNLGNVVIIFHSAWSSPPPPPPPPLDSPRRQVIEKAIRNTMVTSFQPSNAAVPGNVLNMQFKTLSGDLPALAVLMDLAGGVLAGEVIGAAFGLDAPPPDPGSVTNVFLRDGDDFAFAVSGDYVVPRFTSAINKFLDDNNLWKRSFSSTTRVEGRADTGVGVIDDNLSASGSYTLTTTVSVNTVNVTLLDADPGAVGAAAGAAAGAGGGAAGGTVGGGTGAIQLTITGHVDFSAEWTLPGSAPAPNGLDFTVSQLFALSLDGPNAELVLLRGVSVAPPEFKSTAQNLFTSAVNSVMDQVQSQVASLLSLDPNSKDANLGVFLKSLMKPPPQQPGAQPQKEVDPQLTYTSFEIKSSGIVLHGSLGMVPEWQNAQVDFDLNSGTAGSPEYSALNTWIPGGTIQEYIWSYSGNASPPDQNTFVSSNAPGLGYASSMICLTVNGTQRSASGPVVEQPVSRTICKGNSIPIVARSGIGTGGGQGGRAGDVGLGAGSQGRPDIALTQFSASGALEILGHTSLWASEGSPAGARANLIVHFPNEKSVAHLDFLTRALLESKRTDAATAIICVLAADQLAKVRPTQGIGFADNDGAWERLFEVKRRPATFVLGTSGDVVWHYPGELTSADLAAALRTHLVAGGRFSPRLLQAGVRMGQPPPNFIFEYAPGRELTLQKLVERAVVLVFWKSTSKPSLETLRQLEKATGKAGGQGPAVLAINDGEATELVKKVVAEHRLSAIVVPDPQREISLAYGVNVWPTTIVIDPGGLVRDIRYGRFSLEQVKYRS